MKKIAIGIFLFLIGCIALYWLYLSQIQVLKLIAAPCIWIGFLFILIGKDDKN